MKRIQLGGHRYRNSPVKGYALIDDKDYEIVSQHKWHLGVRGYAIHSMFINGKTKDISMHRMIMGSPAGLEIDHKNRNRIDNRRRNLRICTRSQNASNYPVRSSSGIKGVCYHKASKKWEAHVSKDYVKYYLGLFKTKHEAAKVRNQRARELHGEFYSE